MCVGREKIQLIPRYAELLTQASSGPDAPVIGFQTIADAYPRATILQIPYFDGDNWPDIIEDILKYALSPLLVRLRRHSFLAE